MAGAGKDDRRWSDDDDNDGRTDRFFSADNSIDIPIRVMGSNETIRPRYPSRECVVYYSKSKHFEVFIKVD